MIDTQIPASERAAQFWALAQQAEAEHLEITLQSFQTLIDNLKAIGPTSPPTIQQNAKRLADSLTAELENMMRLREGPKVL